jgi:hypothetical protein
VHPGDHLGERVARKVLRARASVESVVEAEINGVRTCRERCSQRVAVTSGGQDLGAAHG